MRRRCGLCPFDIWAVLATLLTLLTCHTSHTWAQINYIEDETQTLPQYKNLRIGNEWEPRSRMIMVNGNIYFHAGRNKNITFLVAPGAAIRFGITNLLDLANSTEVAGMRRALQQSLEQMLEQRGQMIVDQRRMASLQTRVYGLSLKLDTATSILREARNESRSRVRLMRRFAVTMRKFGVSLEQLLKLLSTDECLAAPCKNGGTCLDLFGKYQCLCPSNFEGRECEQRVDECAMYANSPMGCQQNATCVNNANTTGFHCVCPKGWHGHLCQTKANSCELGRSLCGEHGTCIPQSGSGSAGGTGATEQSYKCMCEWGFELNGNVENPECIDIDECAINRPCYPGAECLNLPGNFRCVSCPKGLTGNGVHCHDFDECARDDTNDCSKSPRVECINTHGSYQCGPCPAGYSGDGVSCTKLSPCSEGLNPCHPQATCHEEPYLFCVCPEGMIGEGKGPQGCSTNIRGNPCSIYGLCSNGGTCQVLGITNNRWVFTCHCPKGYWGDHCEKTNGCLHEADFCNQHGQCRTNHTRGENEGEESCECLPGYYGDRCQFEEDEDCSFHTTNETGTISFKRNETAVDQLSTTSMKECSWTIQLLDTRKVLKLTIENFTLPTTSTTNNQSTRGCGSSPANLTLYDTASPEPGKEMWNFCYGQYSTSLLLYPIYTSGGQALIMLTSRSHQAEPTYLGLHWEAVQPRCGGRMVGQLQGRLDYYFEQQTETKTIHCTWYVVVPARYHIELTFARVSMASGAMANCSVNGLEVFDILPSNQRLSSMCESRQTATVLKTSTNYALIHLHYFAIALEEKLDGQSTTAAGPVGFSLSYKALEMPDGCGGEIRAATDGQLEGELASPNYGHRYFPNLDCLWTLNVSSIVASRQSTGGDMKVGIEFLDFDVESSETEMAGTKRRPGSNQLTGTFTNCNEDYVSVTSSDEESGDLIEVFCNLQKPPKLVIAAPSLSIRFHSDSTQSGRGFLLKYKTLCQKDFTAANGTIQSPNYPEISSAPFKCTYRIMAKPQQAVRIKFTYIGLTLDVMSCYYRSHLTSTLEDYIEFSGGHSSNEALNRRYVCQRNPFHSGESIVTSGVRPFEITYSSSGDLSRRNRGFLFEYQLDEVGCGGVYFVENSTTKTITSPNYPDNYLSHMFCVYRVSASEGQAIRVSFDMFDVENSAGDSNCTYDGLRIFDEWFEDEADHGKLLGTFCGMAKPPPLLSASGMVALVFKSDRSIAGAGFSATVESVDMRMDCDRSYTAASGEIRFNPADYARTVEQCIYRIQLPTQHRVLLRIANASLPCATSMLEVRNGATAESPAFAGLSTGSSICNERPVEQLLAHSNRLYIRFASTDAGLESGVHFTLRYEQLDAGCGGHISGLEGAFSAPQYPHKESRAQSCEWGVAVSEGNRLELRFVRIDELDTWDPGSREYDGECPPYARNTITVTEPSAYNEEIPLRRFCKKREKTEPLLLDGNHATVRYVQHAGSYDVATSGFLAEFHTFCSMVELRGRHGTLQSPGYPHRVLRDRHCKWRIRTTPGSRLRLSFHRFRVSNPTTISRAAQSRGLSRVDSSGDTWPLRPLSSVDPRSRQCGDANYLSFSPQDVGEVYGTGLDGVALNVTNSTAPRPAFFCNGVAEPSEVLTTNNSIEIYFLSSANSPENHFWLTWSSVGCGSEIGSSPITANNTRLVVNASADFSAASRGRLRRCQWGIVAPVGYRVMLKVDSLWAAEMDPLKGDCYNHSAVNGLQLYTSLQLASVLWESNEGGEGSSTGPWPVPHETYCLRVSGADSPPKKIDTTLNFTSPSAEFSVLYSLNTSRSPPPSTKGIIFNATIVFIPGEAFAGRVVRVSRDTSAMIQSPNYPRPFPTGTEMIWQFEAPEGYSISYRLLDYHTRNDGITKAWDTPCGYTNAFAWGYLAFTEGPFGFRPLHFTYQGFIDEQRFAYSTKSNIKVAQKICVDIDPPGVNITIRSNVSSVVFQGPPFNTIAAPGRATNGSGVQPSVGFQLKVVAMCGGKLFADARRKVINLGPIGAQSELTTCEWEILRDLDDDEESETIFLRIEQIAGASRPAAAGDTHGGESAKFEVFCSGVSKGIFETDRAELSANWQQHYKEFQCESQIHLVARNLNRWQNFLISYDTEKSFCGGSILGEEGIIALREIAYGTECEWTLENVPGSRVELEVLTLQLPQSEMCSESYLLIRESNATGRPLGAGKYCGGNNVVPKLEGQSIWIRLRHGSPDEETPTGPEGTDVPSSTSLSLQYKKVYGGFTTSPWIVMPKAASEAGRQRGQSPEKSDTYSWKLTARQLDNYIRVEVVEFEVEGENYTLTFYDIHCEPKRVEHSQELCADYEDRAVRFEVASGQGDGALEVLYSHVIPSSAATILFKQGGNLISTGSSFKLHWSEVAPANNRSSTTPNGTALVEGESEAGWTCGGDLIADYVPMILQSPTVNGRYRNDERCKWRIKRPRFSVLNFKLKALDLEEQYTCRYDYLVMTTRDYSTAKQLSEAPEFIRMCKRNELRAVYNFRSFSYDSQAFVYFHTDHSRTYGGFKLEYSLSCNHVFEYVNAWEGVFDEVLTSPQYPLASSSGTPCLWSLMFDSGRDVKVESLDMDLPQRNGSKCGADIVEIGSTPWHFGDNDSFCGNEQVNVTLKQGRLAIKYTYSEHNAHRRGFKLRIRELLHDCSTGAGWHVDELTPQKVISSPDFPKLSPNSLDCRWTLNAPIGRRLKFSVDPHTFYLFSSGNSCGEDFLEIRDGASQHSPLIGRYCHTVAPSTVTSTGSHLYLRYVTDSQIQSEGWNATFALAACGGTLVLQDAAMGVNASITSPNYPQDYPAGSECEWLVQAPKGHFVEAYIDDIAFRGSSLSPNCSDEFVELREWNVTGRVLKKVCNRWALGQMPYRSMQRTLHVKFVGNRGKGGSTCFGERCGFRMHFVSSKYTCGGTISDSSGKLYPPGYPTTLIPHITCQWDFRAGINFRYVLELEFINQKKLSDRSHFLTVAQSIGYALCYPLLEAWDGDSPQINHYSNKRNFLFCGNLSTFTTSTDIATLYYSSRDQNEAVGVDHAGRPYALMPSSNQSATLQEHLGPFHVRYTRVDREFDNKSCAYEIVGEPTSLHIGKMAVGPNDEYRRTIYYGSWLRAGGPFYHIQIRKSKPEQTVHLRFTDFRGGSNYSKVCSAQESKVLITDELDLPYAIDTFLCNGSLRGRPNASLSFVNPTIEIYVYNLPTPYYYDDSPVNFNLSVEFSNCGGVVDESTSGMSGYIRSPGFSAHENYTNQLHCLWVLKAPEGRVIQLRVEFMDIEHHLECTNDYLEVSEGEERAAVLHRYCNELLDQPVNGTQQQDAAVPAEYRRIKSRGRLLTLLFSTDDSVTRRGFSLAYEFVKFEEGSCGFNTHSTSGVIHSPNYPADYSPNSECVWDVSVPSGYHVRLSFDSMDIQESLDCKKDALRISYEQLGRGMAPVGNYYFYYDHEGAAEPLCGYRTPPAMQVESQRVRINFTSDGSISGKGFSMRWDAQCGSIYKMSHGVITSPHYPNYYPNEDLECRYLIDPNTSSGGVKVITLRVLDVDLDGDPYYRALHTSCASDYLEVLDVNAQNFSKMLLCGNKLYGKSSVSIKGPIGVRFVVHSSLYHTAGGVQRGSSGDGEKGARRGKNHRGFKLTYALADCGGDIELVAGEPGGNHMSVTISSPGFPLPYHHGLDCLWNVSAPTNRVLSYKFTDMDIEWNNGCSFDYLELFEGPQLSNTSRITKLCGKKAPPGQQTLNSSRMLVRFVTDPSGERMGFRLVVTATLGPANGCGGDLWIGDNEEKELQLPIDPTTGRYYSELRCLWTLKARDRSKVVQLVVKRMELETRNTQNGTAEEMVGEFPDEVSASSTAFPPLAAGRSSPELLGENPVSTNCYDFITIYDGPKTMSPLLLPPTCSLPITELAPPRFTSSYRMVDVYFESDASTELGGFLITYKAVEPECGGKFKAGEQFQALVYKSEKTLTRSDQKHQRCRFYIFSQQGADNEPAQPVEIRFKQFFIPSVSSDCSEEWLEIRDVGVAAECSHPACARDQTFTSGTLKTCGSTVPPVFVSRTSVVQITTSARISSQLGANFSLDYRLLDSCNRTVDLEHFGSPLASGRLTSPYYPNAYGHNQTCYTYLSAPKDHRILLVFRDFHLERSRRPSFFDSRVQQGRLVCPYDSLTIYYNASQPTLNYTFCGSALPKSILSEGNRLTLVLKTDHSVSHGGYEAFYYTFAVPPAGGRRRRLYELSASRETSGVLTSIGYPYGYEPNILQRATILPPLGQKCVVQVIRTTFEGNCADNDYVRSATTPLDTSGEGNRGRGRLVDDYARLEWTTWQCYIYQPVKLPIPYGHGMVVELYTDNNKDNDGSGFRLQWTCEEFKTIQI